MLPHLLPEAPRSKVPSVDGSIVVSTSATNDTVSVAASPKSTFPFSNVVPPTVKLAPIPTPPTTTNAPVVAVVEFVESLIFTDFLKLAFSLVTVSLLNVTGPSNCVSNCLESPPSTVRRSLIVTSSNTTLNLAGS